MIKTIVFDVGGVITFTEFPILYRNFAKRIGLPFGTFDVQYHKDLPELFTGETTLEDLWNHLKEKGGNPDLDYKAIWLEEAKSLRRTNDELVTVIDELRKKYNLGILSNLTPTRHVLDEEINLYSHFDFTVLSFKEGCKKPDPKIYNLTLERAGVKPEEILFIDDREEMVKAAEALGMQSIQYKDNEQLFKDFQKFDISTL